MARARIAKVVAFLNLKGGVGKTALAVNFAAYCGACGLKTLLIDLDPQTNATFSCIDIEDWKKYARVSGTVADLLGARRHTAAEDKVVDVHKIIRANVFPNVDLIPSHVDLFTVDLDLASAPARERKLKKALSPVMGDYDVVVCDCPPNLTIPTQNALAIATHYVVPINQDFLSGIGIALLLGRVKDLADDLENADIKLAGIVMSRVGRRSYYREASEQSIRQEFGANVLNGKISERTRVSEAAGLQKPIFGLDDRTASQEFTDVCRDLMARAGIAQ
jgi:chromosome partitioning protein